ncbi:hypothetical protein CDCA_CDCA01G0320 [Cyanidium caldarium]|uniref:Uncharacterized protein n=1 Tax=Cyanidium caldarium TaxID=2771 RepID=A0AAV9IQB7_CYACA|nr:hypothetical protein CDCA_CDCA01G0320 [Cyanidium caldarium]|eukprot:ctg_325.g78
MTANETKTKPKPSVDPPRSDLDSTDSTANAPPAWLHRLDAKVSRLPALEPAYHSVRQQVQRAAADPRVTRTYEVEVKPRVAAAWSRLQAAQRWLLGYLVWLLTLADQFMDAHSSLFVPASTSSVAANGDAGNAALLEPVTADDTVALALRKALSRAKRVRSRLSASARQGYGAIRKYGRSKVAAMRSKRAQWMGYTKRGTDEVMAVLRGRVSVSQMLQRVYAAVSDKEGTGKPSAVTGAPVAQ